MHILATSHFYPFQIIANSLFTQYFNSNFLFDKLDRFAHNPNHPVTSYRVGMNRKVLAVEIHGQFGSLLRKIFQDYHFGCRQHAFPIKPINGHQ